MSTTTTELPTMPGMCDIDEDAGPIIRDVFARICDKWSMLILGMLDGQRKRFTALRDSMPGISHRMLTLTLRNLERDGLVSREVFAEVPPRVEYAITELGATMLPSVRLLAMWALANAEAIKTNRDAFDDRD
jgi:DNA-binding HxlR family transcriptional regulator